jgi:hypothetical protein
MNRHAKKRMWERYQLSINAAELETLADKILASPKTWYFKLNADRMICEVDFKGKTIYLIYAAKSKTIISIIRPDHAKDATNALIDVD